MIPGLSLGFSSGSSGAGSEGQTGSGSGDSRGGPLSVPIAQDNSFVVGGSGKVKADSSLEPKSSANQSVIPEIPKAVWYVAGAVAAVSVGAVLIKYVRS